MLAITSAFDELTLSIERTATATPLPDALPSELQVRRSPARTVIDTMPKCANEGRYAGPSTYDSNEFERNNAPILWPKYLDEDTGRVQKSWSNEMMKIRTAFWRPLGAMLVWRWTQYSTT